MLLSKVWKEKTWEDLLLCSPTTFMPDGKCRKSLSKKDFPVSLMEYKVYQASHCSRSQHGSAFFPRPNTAAVSPPLLGTGDVLSFSSSTELLWMKEDGWKARLCELLHLSLPVISLLQQGIQSLRVSHPSRAFIHHSPDKIHSDVLTNTKSMSCLQPVPALLTLSSTPGIIKQ